MKIEYNVDELFCSYGSSISQVLISCVIYVIYLCLLMSFIYIHVYTHTNKYVLYI